MSDIFKDLNPSQRQAVSIIDGPVLVIAGAGSGKTRVIEYRVLHLIEQGIDPGSILLLTFTRRAAQQMLQRAAEHDPRCRQVVGGTFHSFAYRLLHRYGRVLNVPANFTVLDESDAEQAIQRVAAELGLQEKAARAPKKNTLRSIISMSLNKGLPLEDIIARSYPQFAQFTPDIEQVRRRYAEYKVSRAYLDYDDLLVYLKLLLEEEAVARKLLSQHRYVMVDEFQDTNKLQGEITHLVGRHGNIMVVGDDAQSIYGFRGATHGNIMSFPERFAACRVIKLEDNYRSVQPILNVANALLAGMRAKYDKSLRSARQEQGIRPQMLFFRDAAEEASWIAGNIKHNRDTGIALHRQVVLFRSSFISVSLQAELARRNIPFEVFGGLKFYETAHVKDVLAHLKVLVNPRDELSWLRLLMLLEGVGEKTAATLALDISALQSVDQAARYLHERSQVPGRFSAGLRQLALVLAEVVALSNPGEVFLRVVAYYRPILKRQFDDWQDRLNDLAAMNQIIERYGSIAELLADLALDPPQRGVADVLPEVHDERPVTLSTIHSAKGLEWDIVYFIGIADGILPSSFALVSADDLEEERRLFYVGITRAKNELYLTLHHESARGGLSQFNKLSRFLDDPAVRAHLEVPRGEWGEEEPTICLDDDSEVIPALEKKSILDRLMDMYE